MERRASEELSAGAVIGTTNSHLLTFARWAARHRAIVGGRLTFHRQAEGRATTGWAAIGTLSPRTEHLVTAYLASRKIELHPEAVIFRTRSGSPYSRETLAHDFAAIRGLILQPTSADLWNAPLGRCGGN